MTRGLEKGTPCPSFILLATESFSALLDHSIDEQGFGYRTNCERLRLTHLCFADDLFASTAAIDKEVFPVTYLRVPLTSTRLIGWDCQVINDRLQSRIKRAVQVMVFASTLATFLWKGTSEETYVAKLSWLDVCEPANQGGLALVWTFGTSAS
ncbi:uncharacterized protein [Coffea arabica]|uniref:Reverse transcriptase domain-containing protein n=1 Tax=Coffea arabica TaxID=13443 RepID=A0ABM4UEJ8_COFAR